jgi:hypothetical protein
MRRGWAWGARGTSWYGFDGCRGVRAIGVYLGILNHKVEKVKEGKKNQRFSVKKATGATRVCVTNLAFLPPPPRNSRAIYGTNRPFFYGTTTKNFFDFFDFAVKTLK